MKLETSESKHTMSRRDFLKGFLPKNHPIVCIDKERCTGCTLCVIDCPTQALVVHPTRERDSFQLLFRQEACTACGVCEKACPEHCLRLLERESEKDETGKGIDVVFEESLSRCVRCGTPLFPRSMVKKLEGRIFMNHGTIWQLNLCPLCRTKTPFTPHPSLSPSPPVGRGKEQG